MLLIDAPNIFRGATNDYNIRVMRCKRHGVMKKVYIRRLTSGGIKSKQAAQIISEETGVNPFDNIKYRGNSFRLSRQIYAEIMVRYSSLTFTNIGKRIGKDHSTISFSRKVISNMIDTDANFRELFGRIETKVKAIR